MNPCQGVKQFKEQARTRYVGDKEYDALYSVASIPSKLQWNWHIYVAPIRKICEGKE